MKKALAMTLVLLLSLSLFAGCKTSGDDTNVLKVAISPDFAPMEFVDPSKTGQDKYVGFDVSLAKYIAQELGMTLEIMPMDFDACQAAVETGKVDMSISGYSWTEKRENNYNLSDYYYAGENETEQVLITLSENADKYATAESLVGVKVGAQVSSLQESLVTAQLTDSQLVTFTDINTGLQQLKKGDFEVMAVALGNANALINNNPEIVISGFQFEVDEKEANNLILLQKGNDELTEKVNAILAKALEAGYYEVWYEEALSTAGVEQSYDADGNPIVAEEEEPEAESSEIATDGETIATDGEAETGSADGE